MLPTSGAIWLSQIQAEFGGPNYSISTYYRGAGYVTNNNLAVPTGGVIYFSQFHGGEKSFAGSRDFTSPGTYSFTVPVFSTIKFDPRGAGGGGGGSTYDAGAAGKAGTAGTDSVVKNGGTNLLYGNGGGGGAGSLYNIAAAGANGTGVGGDTNTTGGGSNGGAGGVYGATRGGKGGDGGRAVKTYATGESGHVYKGNVLTIIVGTRGTGGAGQVAGAVGGHGAVYVDWT